MCGFWKLSGVFFKAVIVVQPEETIQINILYVYFLGLKVMHACFKIQTEWSAGAVSLVPSPEMSRV